MKILRFSVLEVVSGDYGNYNDLLSEKAQNGLNTEWRKKQSSPFDFNSYNRIGEIICLNFHPYSSCELPNNYVNLPRHKNSRGFGIVFSSVNQTIWKYLQNFINW